MSSNIDFRKLLQQNTDPFLEKKYHFIPAFWLSDLKISERQLHLKATIGTLSMEDEAYTQAYYMAWVFFPCFLLIAILQLILFCLFNHKYHPFSDLLDSADHQGMYTLTHKSLIIVVL